MREFYAMSPEDAYSILEAIAEIHGCADKLKRIAMDEAQKKAEETAQEIDAYIATGEPMDKAGAYGIQGRGALFVAHLDGDYFNVMGLPLCRLGQLLNELGVELL